ncbi:MAG: HAD family phosphatase [Clostridia bacterium]|nr:HAD family phosphatase [Clostridia bacterium]
MQGAIFDLDGTLLDSMWVWSYVDEQFLTNHGLPKQEDYLESLGPLGFYKAAVYTKDYFHMDCSVDEILNDWFLLAKDAYDNQIQLKDGAKEYLEKIKAAGVRLGIATSNSPELFTGLLTRCGILDLFDGIATTPEVSRSKEFPDVYLLAAERIGTKPEETTVFEDIPQGLRGAKAGGFMTVAVEDPWAAKDRESIKALADRYITSFRELL